jgi:hypothetical protein
VARAVVEQADQTLVDHGVGLGHQVVRACGHAHLRTAGRLVEPRHGVRAGCDRPRREDHRRAPGRLELRVQHPRQRCSEIGVQTLDAAGLRKHPAQRRRHARETVRLERLSVRLEQGRVLCQDDAGRCRIGGLDELRQAGQSRDFRAADRERLDALEHGVARQ